MPIARFTKAELTRAILAAQEAGLVVGEAEIEPDGTIRIKVAKVDKAPESAQPAKLKRFAG